MPTKIGPDGPMRAGPKAEANDTAGSTHGRGERRLVTALCYDLVGSTDLLTQSDVEDFDDLILAFQQKATHAIVSRGGSLREVGDGGVALFPVEIDAKDAASLAINSGLEIVAACAQVGREKGVANLHVRVGVATSMALVRHGREKATPDNVTAVALAMATRLQSLAAPDTLLVSQQTRILARRSHVFSFEGTRQVKGIAEPERTWRALSHTRDVGRFYAFGRLGIPTVGREAELRTISECWGAAVGGNGNVVLIEGEAGMGKSRLLHDVRRITRRERKRMLLFQCWPTGSNSTLHPLRQSFPDAEMESGGRLAASAVAEMFARNGIRDAEVADFFSFLLGAKGVRDQTLRDAAAEVIEEKTRQAVSRSLELLCARGPIVFAVEDIHWIDPTSRHLLNDLASVIHRYPALLVLTGRAEPAEGALQMPRVTRIRLARLGPEETRNAFAAMWPKSRSADLPVLLDAMDRITDGVPLFIEEICQWMAENENFTTEQLTQAISPAGASILERVLSARLEPLGPARDVARAAAVVGIRSSLPLLREALPEFDEAGLLDALDRLNEAGLLVRTRSPGDGFYAFRHALIQETIYNATLRKTRRDLHGRLFSALERNREIANWMGIDALAHHAEHAGLTDKAITHFVLAGKESSARSATAEARHLLERALKLCRQIEEQADRDALMLSAYAALGPVLTSREGAGSALTRKVYADGVEIARRRPAAERAKWFPIYWGWWFTGADVDNKRAQEILEELRDVEDAEVQLQIRHCIWAVDFYLGRHESCLAATDVGLPLYDAKHGRESLILYGGHDARVCGLSHRGLSLWFTGRPASAIAAVSAAKDWALEMGHVGSIAHAYYNEVMLHCYRRDFDALRSVIADMRRLTEDHRLRSFAAATEIFEGWAEGNAGHVGRGQEMIKRGLAIHAELQTPEDYPVYCSMLAELMARTGEFHAGVELLSKAETEAVKSGHRYWLAELHHRRARLLHAQGGSSEAVRAALVKSLDISSEQNAVPLMLGAYDTLLRLELFPDVADSYRSRVERAKSEVEVGEPLVVHPEEPLTRRAVVHSL